MYYTLINSLPSMNSSSTQADNDWLTLLFIDVRPLTLWGLGT